MIPRTPKRRLGGYSRQKLEARRNPHTTIHSALAYAAWPVQEFWHLKLQRFHLELSRLRMQVGWI
jgi:hypothetical protein